MPGPRTSRALAEKRLFLVASIAAALAFHYLRAGPWPDVWVVPVKGAAVGLLALYAVLRHSSRDARLLAIMLVIAAAGDMVAEFDGVAARALYAGHHLVALLLYLRHRRAGLARPDKAAAVALLLLPVVALRLLAGPGVADMIVASYGLALGAMAAGAWTSSFPRARVGAGALLLVAADLLLAAGATALAESRVPPIFAWPLAYLGQFLVTTGVIATLRKRDPELRLVSSR